MAESQDFVQDAVLEAIRGFDRLEIRDERALVRWLATVARNRIRDAGRRVDRVAFDHLSERLLEALEALSTRHREVLRLRNLEGLTFARVGEAMEIGEDAAKKPHTRALLQLGREIERL